MSKLYILNGSLVTPRFSVSQDPEVSALSPLIGVLDGRRSIKKALSMAQDRADRVMRDRGYY